MESFNAVDCFVLDDEVYDGVFQNGEVWLGANDGLHSFGIFQFCTLAAGCPDGGTTASIEDFGLKSRSVGIATHFATQSIQFIDEMAFGKAANGRVAGHSSDSIATRGNEERLHAHTGGSEGAFSASVTSANDNKLKSGFHG